jgi:hypothetical protein
MKDLSGWMIMNDQLFNSTFEMKIRFLLLLNVSKRPETLDWLICMDFISCYAEEFQLPYISLHGTNQYMYGEMPRRRIIAQEAVKAMVKEALAQVTVERGYYYKISSSGKRYVKKLSSSYSYEYTEIAKEALQRFKGAEDIELMKIIQDKALTGVKEGDAYVLHKENKHIN